MSDLFKTFHCVIESSFNNKTTVNSTKIQYIVEVLSLYIKKNRMSTECIGIDLGTTACCVAVYRADERVEVIPNSQGNLVTPSYVAFSDNQRLIGDEAKAQVLSLIRQQTRLAGKFSMIYAV